MFAGCYKDTGNYHYTVLPGFYVDSTKVKGEFSVKQYDTLKLSSNLVFDGDKSRLKYSWSTYLFSSVVAGNPADTLATTENLAASISLFPEKYWLEFSATDTQTGRRTTRRYVMTVEGIGSGMMVLYERNNKVDFDLIKTKLLNGLQTQDEVVRNLYSIANPAHPLTGEAVDINMFKYQNIQYISVYTSNNGVALSPADMAIVKDFNSQFAGRPDVIQPQGYVSPAGLFDGNYESSSGFELLVNGGKLYANMVIFAFGKETAFSLLMPSSGDYIAASFPKYGLARIVVYDQLNKRFLGASPISTTLAPITSTGTAFSFQNIGRDMVFMDYGFGGTYMNYAVFKNPEDDGKRYLYVLDLSNSSAKYLWDISHYEKIADAKLFATGTRGQLMYYAAENKVYQIKFDLAGGVENGSINAWPYIPADEEVTCIKLCPHPGRDIAESAKDKYLFVATYNKTTNKGKVYVLQANVTSGALQQQAAAVYEDFGKIKDMAFKF